MSRVVLVLVALFGATASAEPRGRIITIARDHAIERFPLLCEINRDTSGTCLGSPQPGDVITVVDAASVVAEVQIAKVERQGTCDQVWQVQTTVRSGSVQSVHRTSAIGVGGRSGSAMRKIDEDKVDRPSGSPDERVVLALDRDGDNTADILLTRRPCNNNVGQCLESWIRRDRALQRVGQLDIESCR